MDANELRHALSLDSLPRGVSNNPSAANILVLDRNGLIQARFTGAAKPAAVAAAGAALNKVLFTPSK